MKLFLASLLLTVSATPALANHNYYSGSYCTFIQPNGRKITKQARFMAYRWMDKIFWHDGGQTEFKKIGPSHSIDEASNKWYFVERNSHRMRAVREDGAVMRCY